MIKRLYLFVLDHIVAVNRVALALLVPCVFSRHFALVMFWVAFSMNLLLVCGRTKGWGKHENR